MWDSSRARATTSSLPDARLASVCQPAPPSWAHILPVSAGRSLPGGVACDGVARGSPHHSVMPRSIATRYLAWRRGSAYLAAAVPAAARQARQVSCIPSRERPAASRWGSAPWRVYFPMPDYVGEDRVRWLYWSSKPDAGVNRPRWVRLPPFPAQTATRRSRSSRPPAAATRPPKPVPPAPSRTWGCPTPRTRAPYPACDR